MSEPLSLEGEQRLIAQLTAAVAERAAAESAWQQGLQAAQQRAEKSYSEAQAEAGAKFRRERAELEAAQAAANTAAQDRYTAQQSVAERDYRELVARIQGHASSAEAQAAKKLEEARWEASTVYDATRNGPPEQYARLEAQIVVGAQRLEAIDEAARRIILECHQPQVLQNPAPPIQTLPGDDPFQQWQQRLSTANWQLGKIQSLTIPPLFKGPGLAGIWVGLWVVLAVVARVVLGPSFGLWFGAATGGAIVVGGLLAYWLYRKAGYQLATEYGLLQGTFAEADELKVRCLREAAALRDAQALRIVQRRDRELQAAATAYDERMAKVQNDRTEELEGAASNFRRLTEEQVARRDAALQETAVRFPPQIAAITATHEEENRVRRERYDAEVVKYQDEFDAAWSALASRWRKETDVAVATLAGISESNRRLFPAWDDPRLPEQLPAMSMPPAIRFGQFDVEVSKLPGGVSPHPELAEGVPEAFSLPALLTFPNRASLLIQAADDGRAEGIRVLQSVMLRLITAIPPGKARFTIIDPVGLGENFAAFMHLADYDDALVTNRIWTEPQHIEQRLADLTEQMENVIQKYLRNDFETIDEYNAHAGEIAEPFRFLVIANFPVNFSEAAARRLTSIATSGARCGVYTLVVADTKQPAPPRFDMADLERSSATLVWKKGKFVWKNSEFAKFPLTLDTPPSPQAVTELVRLVGEHAKDSRRVEVPFEFITPSQEQWWTGDTSRGIQIALGRAGATKLQYLKLGQGTSQHVLVAGKTGSGKSTLLHALVTNLALYYGPDQIELYLIDFKKGVEFKTYATEELPHARVIAIESEREFGLSVLQRLDAELKQRGDRFRAMGVQDLAGFRQAAPDMTLPRILLVVDEFHELFVEDDKIAQDCSLLLDRLVRQGRAFGIHVLLGSQTLGGAYSLARSTIGQMAVRIALQCSESDAHLILSEDNSAARLLSRPGEAIYNDANGMIEGNSPFQVVWLPDERREHYLKLIHGLGDGKPPRPGRRIVFEGNVPADIRKNDLLRDVLTAPVWVNVGSEAHAWLGEAIAIKDPTAALFRPQNGSNLLIVGQRDETARSLLATSLLSLAAQYPPQDPTGLVARARFYVLEPAVEGELPPASLEAVSRLLPHKVIRAARRDLPALLAELTEELERRQTDYEGDHPAIFLFVSDLGRFRDLRRPENEYSFSMSGEDATASPSKQFGALLREGPVLGIHTLVWCDTLNNLNRTFDRQALREFDLRVLLQMSASDSSHLIDTPLASKLGPNLALFHNEEEGRIEKFRPYQQPAEEWLHWYVSRLTAQRTPASDHLPLK